MPEPLLSIIVLVGPGDRLDHRLRSALDTRPASCELIISAAGTTPDSSPDSSPQGAVTLAGPAGRGRQLNAGAKAASAGWLWFLHADSVIQPDAVERALAFAQRGCEAIGYGWLRFLPDGPALTQLNAGGANLRSRLLGLPYGDQSLCIPAKRLQSLGGFREDLERGEDLDLIVRARCAGLPARPMGLSIATSARRYAQRGWLRTTWQHQVEASRLIRAARAASQTRPA